MSLNSVCVSGLRAEAVDMGEGEKAGSSDFAQHDGSFSGGGHERPLSTTGLCRV